MTIVGVVCILSWAWLFLVGCPAEQRQLEALQASRTPDPRRPAPGPDQGWQSDSSCR